MTEEKTAAIQAAVFTHETQKPRLDQARQELGMYLFMVLAVVGAQTQVMGLPAPAVGVILNEMLPALAVMPTVMTPVESVQSKVSMFTPLLPVPSVLTP